MLIAWIFNAAAADLALVVDGHPDETNGLVESISEELQTLLRDGTPTIQTHHARYNRDTGLRALKDAFASDAKVVLTVGPLSSALVLSSEPSKPTLAALAMGNPTAPPGVTLLRLESRLEDDLATLSHIIGSDDVALALPPYLVGLLDVDVPVVPLTADAAPPPHDGVLIGGGRTLGPQQRDALFASWTEAGVAAMVIGAQDLPPNVMGVFQNTGIRPVSRRVALAAVDLLSGREGRSGILSFRRGDLMLSASVLHRLDIHPPFDVLADAQVVGLGDDAPRWSLLQAIEQGLERNPQLAALQADLAGRDTAVARAWAPWLPQVVGSASWSQVDPAVASAFQPQTTVQTRLTASQLIWSDEAATNTRMQADLARARDAEWLIAEQDIAYEIGLAFINLQRTESVIRIRRADIERARVSLSVARHRHRVGDASSAEVSRWEAEMASARASQVASWTSFRAAMVRLNQLTGQPAEAVALPAPEPLSDSVAFHERLANPQLLNRLATLAADLSVERAPELQQLDDTAIAQDRLLKLRRRAYFMPTAGVQGTATYDVFRTRADVPGMGDPNLGGPASPLYWSAGATVELPLFVGGARRADRSQSQHEVASLAHRRRQLELALRSGATVAVNRAHGASWRSSLRRDAADAAVRSLDAALDAYSAGATTQTQVTEARSTALQLQLAATDAEFETSSRILDLLRATAAMPTPGHPDAHTELRTVLLERLEATR